MRRLCLVAILPIACFDFDGNVRRSEKFQEVCKFTEVNLTSLEEIQKFRKNRQEWEKKTLLGCHLSNCSLGLQIDIWVSFTLQVHYIGSAMMETLRV